MNFSLFLIKIFFSRNSGALIRPCRGALQSFSIIKLWQNCPKS